MISPKVLDINGNRIGDYVEKRQDDKKIIK